MKIILGILLAVIIIAAVVVYIINHDDYCEDCESTECCDICPYRK
jgi:hypothetical protein